MRARDGSPEFAALCRHWCRWTAIVELFARRRGARRRVDPQGYQTLHQQLLAACRSVAGSVGEEQRAFYQNLESLAQPWLTCRALEQADREILLDLLSRCQQAERTLVGRTWVYRARRWRRPVFAVLAVAVGLGLLVWTADWVWFPLLRWVQDEWRVAWLALKRSGEAPRWIALGILVILIAIFVVSRSARS